MRPPDSDNAARQEENAALDRYLRHHFRVDPPEELTPSASESGEPDEDERFAAYMQAHFPGG